MAANAMPEKAKNATNATSSFFISILFLKSYTARTVR
jgi:hypothetical protein